MSKTAAPASLLVEWSPRGTTIFDALTGRTESFASGTSLPFSGRDAVLVISRRSSFVRTTRVPNVGASEVRMVLMMRMAELFPIQTELAYDFFLADDVNQDGRLAFVAAMPATELSKAMAELKASNIKVKQTVPAGIGSLAVAQQFGLEDAAVVEQSEEGATIDLVVQGVLRACRIVGPTANLDVELTRSYSLAGVTCLPTVAIGPNTLTDPDHISRTHVLETLGTHWDTKITINLESPEEVAKRNFKRRNTRLRQGGLMAVGALALAAFTYMDRADAAAAIQATKAKQASSLKKFKAAQTAAETTAATTAAWNKTLETAFQPAQNISDVIGVITNYVPKDVWLSGITAERGKPISLRGVAKSNESVTAFLKSLNNEKRLRDVKLVIANNSLIERIPVVQFSVSAFPVGNLPIVETRKSTTPGVAK